jgi:hypothetical protein
MSRFPTYAETEVTLRDALPCPDCDCLHRSVKVVAFLDDDGEMRVSHFRLNCGKQPVVNLERPELPPEDDDEFTDDDEFYGSVDD